MKVICAWCRRDGLPGDLGEREPLDNPEPTHGVCSHHMAQLLEGLPSRSFPDAELLIVVPREEIVLYEKLERAFAGLSRIKVVLDRRVADRRAVPRQGSEDRRHARRRIREGTVLPITIVRFTPKAPPPAEQPTLQ